MKKKGLIISTVVMVVVLLASLTTATYAWFSATSNVSVSPITMQVGEGADVKIGVSTNNDYLQNATVNNFLTGSVTWDAGKWTGGDAGLSSTINTGLNFNSISKAVGTGVHNAAQGTEGEDGYVPANWSIDSTWDATHTVIKANGNGSNVDQSTAEEAIVNEDYVKLTIGVRASESNLTDVFCVVTINPTDNKLTLGMNAAITVRYNVNNTTWKEEDIYGSNKYSTEKTSVTNPDAPTGVDLSPGAMSFKIPVAHVDTGSISTETIYIIELIVYINGNDTDCLDAATGVSSDLMINFTTDKPKA